jgi:sarcosine oxidase
MRETYDVAVVGLGALGSGAAWQLSRRGLRVLGLEQFQLGHDRGASHDTSRILRHSYHTPDYVRLTFDAYRDWSDLEAESGETLVTVTGGLDLFPPGAAISPGDYTASMAEVGVPYEVLTVADVAARWPQWSLPEGTVALHQERTAIVPAARGTAAMQAMARRAGARLVGNARVTAVRQQDDAVEVDAAGTTYSCAAAVVCADAWTSQLLAPLGWDLPLTVTEEQVTYFEPASPELFAPQAFPVWIWMDDPSYYGFPTYGEATIKAAQDCGGPMVTAEARSGEPDPEMLDRLAGFLAARLPASGRPVRSRRCLYTLTPDRDFVLGAVPGAERIVVGLGAAHGFKFAPTLGRRLADLSLGAEVTPDLEPFRLDRPGLTDPAYAPSWLV